MNRFVYGILLTLAAALLPVSGAYATVLQPAEADLKDTFGYEFLPTFPAGNLNSGGFANYLAVGATTTGHTTKSLIEFDLSTVSLTAAEVTSATLEVFAIDTTLTGFGANPTVGSPLTVNLLALDGAWDEDMVAYSTIPTTAGQYTSTVVSDFNTTVSFDMTQLVKDWLDGSLANNGLLLEADTAVGGSPSWVYSVFNSSLAGNGPKLTIVPEPTGLVLALCALPAAAWIYRKRRVATRASAA